MDKGNFKIGDKVRLKNPKTFPHLGTKVLTITEADCGDKFIPVNYDGMRVSGYFPLYPFEIEHLVKVGEQLLFAFMDN